MPSRRIPETEAKAAAVLATTRWPDGPVCMECGAEGSSYKAAAPRAWFCTSCCRRYEVTDGTCLELTPLARKSHEQFVAEAPEEAKKPRTGPWMAGRLGGVWIVRN